jgi:hypothetical protein
MRQILNRVTVSLAAASLLLFSALTTHAHGQNRAEVKATVGKADVTVEYGRPALRGRDPLKMMQPGTVWRLGADAPTTLATDTDLDFGGTRVPKGKYVLLAQMAEGGKWFLIVSNKPHTQYDPSAKVANIPLETKEAGESVEQLTINLSADRGSKGRIEIAWGTMRLVGSFAATQ